MSSESQDFVDFLVGISDDIRKFSAGALNSTEARIDAVATQIRNALAESQWLPSAARPPPPPPPPAAVGLFASTGDWISRHRALTAALIAFVGTGAVVYHQQKTTRRRRRRAKRAPNGARREVVVIAGPTSSAVTRSLALDLERRGFIVYIAVHSAEEESEIAAEGKLDIRPLALDLVDPPSSASGIQRFSQLFAGPQRLNFAGLVIAPDLTYPTGPIESVGAELWSDTLNAKVLGAIATTQAFLPMIIEHTARVIVLTPSNASALHAPFHGVEATVTGALDGFAGSLRRELAPLGVSVSRVKLGALDLSAAEHKSVRQHLAPPLAGSMSMTWPSPMRSLYAANFVAASRAGARLGITSTGAGDGGARGTSLRELHHVVFDALEGRRASGVVRVGRGSAAYAFFSTVAPGSLVDWMLGIKPVQVDRASPSASLSSSSGDVKVPAMEDSTAAWESVEASISA